MDDRQRFRCVIIGETSLPLRCAEILLARGHEIVYFVTRTKGAFASSITRSGAVLIDPAEAFEPVLADLNFDFLFSIANPVILSPETLAKPAILSINYHDGPLPRYAGVHATSWAIINGESVHGVTWHRMSEAVDGGDILLQRTVPVDAAETALTLNLKCYEVAAASFEELIDRLERGAVVAQKQDMSRRTYFSRNHRPSPGCVISWNQPASQIDRLTRALDFGKYPNGLCRAKFLLGDRVLVCRRARALDTAAGELPGTIVSIDNDSVVVASADRRVAVGKVFDLEGFEADIPELLTSVGLRVGDRLREPVPGEIARLAALDVQDGRNSRSRSLTNILRPAISTLASRMNDLSCTSRIDILGEPPMDRPIRPTEHSWNTSIIYRVEGKFDPSVFREAFCDLVARQPEWFYLQDAVRGENESSNLDINERAASIDLCGSDVEATERDFVDAIQQPFPAAAPRARVRVTQVAEGSYDICVVFHPLIADAASRQLILSELARCYATRSNGALPHTATSEARGPHFSTPRRPRLAGDGSAVAEFWTKRLDGFPAALRLPAEGVSTPFNTREVTERCVWPRQLLDMVRAFAAARGADPLTILLAVFQSVISRYSGETKFVVGMPSIAGEFTPIRADLSGDPTFPELIERVQAECFDASTSLETFPLGEIAPYPMQVCFAYEAAESTTLSLPSLRIERRTVDVGLAGFDLALTFAEMDVDLALDVRYRADQFTGTTIQRFIGHVRTFLEAAIADSRPVSSLPLLTQQERRQLLVDWNGPTRPLLPQDYVHHAFAATAARVPHAVALSSERETVTYAELNRRADELSRRLRTIGVGRNSVVAILLDRSVEMVVAFIATLKAGGAYLPLDPGLPPERLAYMIECADAAALLTDSRLRRTVDSERLAVVVIGADEDAGRETVSPVEAAHTLGTDLAYVMYTSGSTGRPKGVMVSHQALANYVRWTRAADEFTEGDAVLQQTPATFDASIWELFTPLTSGARVVLSRPGGHYDFEYTLRLLEDESVTIVQFVPSVLGAISQIPRFPTAARTVRSIICGGEAFATDLAARVSELLPNARIFNHYGPTEITVAATRGPADGSSLDTPYVSIGRPHENIRVYVVDQNFELLPVGVPGEICLGGIQVAMGYVNQPGLTAERFVADPFSDAPSRMYRTGDIGRWCSNGTLEFFGRIDDLVKIRGIRIELGEIESTLRSHSAILDCAVVVRGHGDGATLAAYCVCPGAVATPGELQRFLAERLPYYMVPATVTFLPELPRSTNGKLDRRALPSPATLVSADTYVEPRSALEASIARVWSDVLNRERIGVHDSFFEIGGTSLNGMQIMARLSAQLLMTLPLHTLFEAPTVADLASRFVSANAIDMPRVSSETAYESAGRHEAPLSYGQEILWLAQRTDPQNAAYNITDLFCVRGSLDVDALQRALEDVSRRQSILRTQFVEQSGSVLQRVGEHVAIKIDNRDLREFVQPEEQARALARSAARTPFDLNAPPYVRAFAFRVRDEEWFVGFVMHHILTDQWSMEIFFRELGERYQLHLRQGEAPPLPLTPLRYTYLDYAQEERTSVRGATLDSLVAHWTRELHGTSAVLELPVDRRSVEVTSAAGSVRSEVWPQTLLIRAQELSRRSGTTLFVTLLAAFEAVLGRYTGQETFVVGAAYAARKTSADADLMGYFTSVLPIRADFSSSVTFLELLRRVHATSFAAWQHSGIPFEQVNRLLGEHSASGLRSPFRAVFNFDPIRPLAFVIPGAEITRLPIEIDQAKFDLFFNVSEMHDGLRATVEYRTQLYDADTVDRLLGHVRTYLEGATQDPNRPVTSIDIVSPVERQRLAILGDGTAGNPGATAAGRGVHVLIAENAAREPESIAVSLDGATLSYGELDARATALAARLRGLNVGPGAVVAIFLERSLEAIIGVLAVLKAGGAYLPIDPEYPADRIAFMLEDADPSAIVSLGRYRNDLAAHLECTVFLDDDANSCSRGASPSNGAAVREAELHDPAYVIYTSGSTGQPKGVIVSHRGLANFILYMQDLAPLASDDAVLHWASLSFDASVWEIFHALAFGARLVICKPGGNLDADYLASLVPGNQVTALLAVPSMMRVLLEAKIVDKWTSVNRIFLGAEAVTAEVVSRTHAALPSVRLTNLYGPTEATVCATSWEIPPDCPAVIPIGRPIANVSTFVFSPELTLLPVGVPGELYIGGAGVALGYLNRADLTRERFIIHRFRPAERLYRTGDRARWRADGTLEYLGRLDAQVKLHGIRLELGEVESALRALPEVADAACALVENGAVGSRLVAYVVARPGQRLRLADARSSLLKTLPAIAVPSSYIPLERIPLTVSGKLDRASLPDPADFVAEPTNYRPPVTNTEKIVADIWSEVLALDRVSLDDDFFERGGDSLTAMRVTVRLENMYGRAFPVRAIFDGRTVGGVAAVVDGAAAPSDDEDVEEILLALGGLSEHEAAHLASQILGGDDI